MVRRLIPALLLIAAAGQRLAAQPLTGLDTLLQSEVARGHIAGAVIQVKRGDAVLHRGAYGFAQRYLFGLEPLSPPDTMTTGHVFDLASLTKVLGTTFALMLLVDREQVDLDAPVHTYLPEFTGGEKSRVTVRHLLTHTGGLAQWKPVYYHAATASEAYAYITQLPLEFEVGEERHYSDLGFMLLGYLVERVSGQELGAFLQRNLYERLGLDDTAFRPLGEGFEASGIAATSHGNPFERRMVYDDAFGYDVDVDPDSWNGWRRYTLRGEVNDGNAFHAHGGTAGHAGLFSTVDDIQVLLDVLRRGGIHDTDRIISTEVVREFLTADHTGNGIGWAMDPPSIAAHRVPPGTFGHTGFTGTNVVVIPEHDLSIILLTNRQNVGPTASGTYYDLNPTRRRIVDLVLEHVRE